MYILSLYIILLHCYSVVHVSTIWFLFIDHTRDTTASDSSDTCICAYIRLSFVVTARFAGKRTLKKKPEIPHTRAHPFPTGVRFPVCWGDGGGYCRERPVRRRHGDSQGE